MITADPKKILELKKEQESEAQKLQKFKKWVNNKKSNIAHIGSKIMEEEDKRLRMGS